MENHQKKRTGPAVSSSFQFGARIDLHLTDFNVAKALTEGGALTLTGTMEPRPDVTGYKGDYMITGETWGNPLECK